MGIPGENRGTSGPNGVINLTLIESQIPALSIIQGLNAEQILELIRQTIEKLPAEQKATNFAAIHVKLADQALDLPQSTVERRRKIKHVLEFLERIGQHHQFVSSFQSHISLRNLDEFLIDLKSDGKVNSEDLAAYWYALGLVQESRLALRDALRSYHEAAQISTTSREYLAACSTMALSCGLPAIAEQHSNQWLLLVEDDALEEARVRCTLASSLYEQFRPEEAIVEYSKAFIKCEHIQSDSRLKSLILNNRGYAHVVTKRFNEADNDLHSALRLRQMNNEPKKDIALTMNNISALYRETGQVAKAESTLISARTEIERHYDLALGKSNDSQPVANIRPPILAQTLNNLGSLYLESFRDYTRAFSTYKDALDALCPPFDDWVPNVSTTLHNLGLAAALMGSKHQSDNYFRRAIAGAESLYGPTHPHVTKIRDSVLLTNFGSRNFN